MNAEAFKSEIADWIHSQTADYDRARDQILRFNDVYDLLREGIAHFWFRKGDGSLRSAYGTLDTTIIGRHGGVPHGKDGEDRPVNGTVPYFDLEKDSWRCFKANAVQEVDFGYGIGPQ